MKKNFEEWNDLMKDIRSDIDDVLSKEVFGEVRDIEMEHIKSDVFAQYTPEIYERRFNGGIDDPENIIGREKDMHLVVVNEAQFNDEYGTYNHGYGLPQLINDGNSRNGFYYDFPGVFNAPRPFIDYAKAEVERSDRVDKAFEYGMKKRGKHKGYSYLWRVVCRKKKQNFNYRIGILSDRILGLLHQRYL